MCDTSDGDDETMCSEGDVEGCKLIFSQEDDVEGCNLIVSQKSKREVQIQNTKHKPQTKTTVDKRQKRGHLGRPHRVCTDVKVAH